MLSDHHTRLVIDSRFSGLPEIAHGGYVAGVLAGALGAPTAEIRLRRPALPGRALTLERAGDELVELRDGDALVADAAASELSLDVPVPVTLAEAEAAARRFPAAHRHPFPYCFGCGTARVTGDGLRIFVGPVKGRRLVAASWVPSAADGDESGHVHPELVWAALDCPQLWALLVHAPPAAPEHAVTASLAATLVRPVLVGEPHVVIAWPLGREGRNRLAGAAVLGPDGDVCAVGRQKTAPADWGVPLTWVTDTANGARPTRGGEDA